MANRSYLHPSHGTVTGSSSLTLSLIGWTPSGRRPPQAGACRVPEGPLPTKVSGDPVSNSSGSIHPRHLCPHVLGTEHSTLNKARVPPPPQSCALLAQPHGQCKLRQPQTWAPPAWGPGGLHMCLPRPASGVSLESSPENDSVPLRALPLRGTGP